MNFEIKTDLTYDCCLFKCWYINKEVMICKTYSNNFSFKLTTYHILATIFNERKKSDIVIKYIESIHDSFIEV